MYDVHNSRLVHERRSKTSWIMSPMHVSAPDEIIQASLYGHYEPLYHTEFQNPRYIYDHANQSTLHIYTSMIQALLVRKMRTHVYGGALRSPAKRE